MGLFQTYCLFFFFFPEWKEYFKMPFRWDVGPEGRKLRQVELKLYPDCAHRLLPCSPSSRLPPLLPLFLQMLVKHLLRMR